MERFFRRLPCFRFFRLIYAVHIFLSGSCNVLTLKMGEDKVGRTDPTADVQCNSGQIDIWIPKNLVRSEATGKLLPPHNVVFQKDASDACQARELDDRRYVATIYLNKRDCGSSIERKRYQTVYKNKIVFVDSDAGKVKSLLNITCIYPVEDELAFLPPSASEISLFYERHEIGTVKMTFYRDKSYSEDSKIKAGNAEISVGHFVFALLELAGSRDLRTIHLVVERCFASYFPKATEKRLVHNFISGGCADEYDATVAIRNNGDGRISMWKYQMFKWVNATSQRIYLFCEVGLCDASKEIQCDKRDTKKSCFGFTYDAGRSKREATSDVANYSISEKQVASFGPIFPVESVLRPDNSMDRDNFDSKEKDQGRMNPNALPIIIGVIMTVCLIVLAFAAYLFKKRKIATREAERENIKRTIEQGFAFVFTSSDDPQIKTSSGAEGKAEKSDSLQSRANYCSAQCDEEKTAPHGENRKLQRGHSCKRQQVFESRPPSNDADKIIL